MGAGSTWRWLTPATGLGLLTGGPSALGCAITPSHRNSPPRMKHSIRLSVEVWIAGRAGRLADFKALGGICDGRNAH